MKSARQSRIIISSRTSRRTRRRSSRGGCGVGREWLRFLEMMLTKPGRSVKVAAINVFQVDEASGDSHSQRFMSDSQEGVCESVCARLCVCECVALPIYDSIKCKCIFKHIYLGGYLLLTYFCILNSAFSSRGKLL